MRITEGSMMRNYLTSLNKNVKNLSDSNQRLSSGSKYSRVADNISDTSRALVVREQLSRNAQYVDNIEYAGDELSSAESSLTNVNDILKTIMERINRGTSGTLDATDRKVIGNEIDSLKEQVLLSVNAKFGSRYLFGNSNNSDPPFAEGNDGRVLYNGVDVDSIYKDAPTGKLMYKNPDFDASDPDSKQYMEVPENKDVYIDVGLGIAVSGDSVNIKTGVKMSTSGIEALGFGVSLEGDNDTKVSNNLMNLLSDIANAFRSNDLTSMEDYSAKLGKQKNNLMLSISDIGSRTNFLSRITQRLENDNLNLTERQSGLESVDPAEEAIYNTMYETSWLVNLQLGSKILPTTIFDFIR